MIFFQSLLRNVSRETLFLHYIFMKPSFTILSRIDLFFQDFIFRSFLRASKKDISSLSKTHFHGMPDRVEGVWPILCSYSLRDTSVVDPI